MDLPPSPHPHWPAHFRKTSLVTLGADETPQTPASSNSMGTGGSEVSLVPRCEHQSKELLPSKEHCQTDRQTDRHSSRLGQLHLQLTRSRAAAGAGNGAWGAAKPPQQQQESFPFTTAKRPAFPRAIPGAAACQGWEPRRSELLKIDQGFD